MGDGAALYYEFSFWLPTALYSTPIEGFQRTLFSLAGGSGGLRQGPACPNASPEAADRGLVKTGGRLVKHARYYWLLLAEGHLTRQRFGSMLQRIAALPLPNE